MFAAASKFVCHGSRVALTRPVQVKSLLQSPFPRNYASRAGRRVGQTTAAPRQTLKERLMAPAGTGALNAGRLGVAAASGLGLGALCFYGLGLSNEPGALEGSMIWSEEIKQRIRATYSYFGASIVVTAASAVAVSRNPRLMSMVSSNSLLAMGAMLAGLVGTSMVCQSIPYKEGFGAKQLAWLVHSGMVGLVVAPLTMLGGPLLVRAAWYTAGVVGGLSAVAVCAPSDKFLSMRAPLGMGLGAVFVASLGSSFFPPTTALGAGLYSISIYGGLVLFGAFLLYDTQKIIKRAETHPSYSQYKYDPINNSIGIFMDTVNIFIRIAMMLATGGSRKK